MELLKRIFLILYYAIATQNLVEMYDAWVWMEELVIKVVPSEIA